MANINLKDFTVKSFATDIVADIKGMLVTATAKDGSQLVFNVDLKNFGSKKRDLFDQSVWTVDESFRDKKMIAVEDASSRLAAEVARLKRDKGATIVNDSGSEASISEIATHLIGEFYKAGDVEVFMKFAMKIKALRERAAGTIKH